MAKNLSPPLVRLHWDVTKSCNFRCSFCGVDAGLPLTGELSRSDRLNLIKEASFFGVRMIRLMGGEPYACHDILDILRLSAKHKMLLLFSTNGSLINDEAFETLSSIKRWLRYVQVSLYGTCEEEYETVTGGLGRGRFKSVCKNIKRLASVGIHPTIHAVLTPDNCDKISEFAKIAADCGAKALRVSPAKSAGRAAKHKGICLSRKVFYESLHSALEAGQLPIPIEVTEYPLFADYLEKRLPIRVERLGCSASLSEIYIDADGSSHPCPFGDEGCSSSVNGAVQAQSRLSFPEMSLEEIWLSPRFNAFRETHTQIVRKGEHAHCKYAKNGTCQPCPLSDRSCISAIKSLGWESRKQGERYV